jgi:predicted dehydrogenase
VIRHRVLLCGYGKFGRVYARRIQEHSALKLCGVVERASMIERVWEDGLTGHSDIEDAMTVHAPTLVVIATSEEAHAHLAVRALSRHAHVLLAKPGALFSSEAQRVARVASEHRRNVFVDWTPMWMRGYEVLKEQAATIGEWRTIRFTRRDWSTPREWGVVWDLMPHDVAMLTGLVGGEQIVDVSSNSWKGGAHVTLTYQNGLVARPRGGLRSVGSGTLGRDHQRRSARLVARRRRGRVHEHARQADRSARRARRDHQSSRPSRDGRVRRG